MVYKKVIDIRNSSPNIDESMFDSDYNEQVAT